MTRALDYALFPLLFAAGLAVTHAAILFAPEWAVTSVAITPIAIAIAILERVRPERADYVPFDQPLYIDAAHFVFNANLGYAIAGVAILGVQSVVDLRLWPTDWPLAIQLAIALVLGEALAYWQHRAYHRFPVLWRFHVLHHSGARVNLVRAGRFHFVDAAPAAFFVVLPHAVLGAPDSVLLWVLTITGILGALQHGNMRVRTPAWLDGILCTPAVHRHHHSIDPSESDQDFGTLVMLFDRLFGTYGPPRPAGPLEMGLDDDPVPRGFWPQVISPFRR